MKTPSVYRRLVSVGGLFFCVAILFLSAGCASTYSHKVSAYQNGKKLGEWKVIDTFDQQGVKTTRTIDGKRIRILPAYGVPVDRLWFRAGGVVIVSKRNP